MAENKSYFFCGIGGSGMLPLAMIVAARGAPVAGSDRSRDQGRSADKFDWHASRGIPPFPQDVRGPPARHKTVAPGGVQEVRRGAGGGRACETGETPGVSGSQPKKT